MISKKGDCKNKGKTMAKAEATAKAEADPYGMTTKKAKARTDAE